MSPRQRKRTRFCFFYRAGRIKEGFPGGERKGVARSEQRLLSPSTELESLARIAAGRSGSVLGRDGMVVAAKRSDPEISLPHFLWLHDTKKVDEISMAK